MSPSARDLLRRELEALLRRVGPWGVTRWRAAGRADTARRLVLALAEHGRRAGSGAPPGVVPEPVAPHGLADQIAVLAADLLAAGPDDAQARAALGAVLAARTALDGSPPPGDAAAAARGADREVS